MSYVPVQMWVPDTPDGPVVQSVDLKPCDICHVVVPINFMDDHISTEHPPPPEVTPH